MVTAGLLLSSSSVLYGLETWHRKYWVNHRTHLFCFLSLWDHFLLLPDVHYIGNHCFLYVAQFLLFQARRYIQSLLLHHGQGQKCTFTSVFNYFSHFFFVINTFKALSFPVNIFSISSIFLIFSSFVTHFVSKFYFVILFNLLSKRL